MKIIMKKYRDIVPILAISNLSETEEQFLEEIEREIEEEQRKLRELEELKKDIKEKTLFIIW